MVLPVGSAVCVQVGECWVGDVSFDGVAFTGRLDSEPMHVKGLALNKVVSVGREDGLDWMIVEDGLLIGGYTLRVTRRRMSPLERAEFDKSMGFVIDDRE